MQKLVGPAYVRFLPENTKFMDLMHFVAFCKLLGLPSENSDKYIWDVSQFGLPN